MKHHFLFALTILAASMVFLTASFSPAPALAQEDEKYVSVRVIADQTQGLQGGETLRIGIVQDIAPGWHVYWKNPGDSGAKAEVEWDAPDGFSFSDLDWPVPHKLPFGPLMNFGYENQVVNFVTLDLPEFIPATPTQIGMRIDLLVCEEICVPESHTATLTLNGSTPASPQEIERFEQTLPKDLGWAAQYSEQDGRLVFKVVAPDAQTDFPARMKDIDLFPEEWGLIENTAKSKVDIKDDTLIIRRDRGARDIGQVPVSKMVVSYKDRDGQIQGLRFAAMLAGAPGTEIEPLQTVQTSLVQALFFALLGGLILNLMPCVFPVLSMKALSLCQLNDKEESKARLSGLAYTAGVLVSFAVIAGLLLVLKAAGAQIGWGFQLQSPVIIGLLALLVYVIGLNLSGFFEFSSKFAGIGSTLTQKEGASGSFFTGVLATLVATPCTAPFMGAAMGFALTQPAVISMSVFLMLGFGLALPYLLLAYVPALRQVLPKPGAWMERFKEFLAFPMYLTAAWLIWVLSQQAGAMGVLNILIAFIGVAFVIWTLRYMPKKGFWRMAGRIGLVAAILGVAYGLFNLNGHTGLSDNAASVEAQNWEAYSPETLQLALDGDKPVFVNMTAAWCITCKVNERVAINTQGTRTLFETHEVVYLKGDWTNQDPEITTFLSRYGRNGVPLYVYYGPRDMNTGLRPEPEVLPQILTPFTVKEVVTQHQS